ncbi:MAG: outer membrane protein assembly factor [Flavobacteriaceae bacterium]|nr:outer membrane protein assembly factor [Flavobacteriaceae bacterium]
MLNYFAKIIVFILFLIIISCDATKRVPDGKYLLEKNKVIVNDKKTLKKEVISFLRQKPNQKVLGFPFSLHLYNLGNPDFKVRFKKLPKKEKKLTNFFSEKQVNALAKSYTGINGWFLKNGNPPVISDSIQIKKSVNSLYKYYISKGFFDVNVTYKEHKKDNKRSIVDYLITTKDQYFIDTITASIHSPVLDSIYNSTKEKSFIIKGNSIDYKNFEKEENRLIELYRNSGIYHFGRNIAGFWIDSLSASQDKNILLKIPNRIVEENDSLYSTPFKIQKIKKVNIFTDFSFNTKNQKPKDSVTYKGYTFYANKKLKYNPKYLANAIIIQPDSIYKDKERDLTRKHLRELQNFRPSIDIKYQENGDKSLTTNIYLTPLKKHTLGFDTEIYSSNIKPLGILGKFSWLNRNIFKGAEILEMSFQGSFLNTSKDDSKFFNAWEIGISSTLKIPRILFPGNTSKFIPKRMTPKTNIGLSINLQRNIGLDRQNITGGIDYTWQSLSTTNHKFELLNVQYINNENIENYFNIFNSEYEKLNVVSGILENSELQLDNTAILGFIERVFNPVNNFEITNPEEFLEVQKVDERRNILIEDVLVPVISYAYNYNNRENFNDNNFSAFTGRIISSGSVTSLFVKETAESGRKELFGLPIAQYLKTEIEYKKYWGINSNTSLVYRGFIGAAIPFGNSDDIPFSRSYRAGGSNDIRAWKTFDLGPGSEFNTLEFNTGSLKLTTNLEYRFKVINSIYSAFFIDAGNIWDITNSTVTNSKGKFNGFSSLKDIAIGSGFGIRYDFSFLVFRFDTGFKTYEPYLSSTNKWFQNYNFGNAVFNIGINYPF